MSPINILIVDDHPLFRSGIRWSLEQNPQFVIVGEAADGSEALRLADELSPDVILVDLSLPGMNGLEVARALKRRQPQAGVIILTMHQDDEQLFNAIRAGASAYCTKDIEPEQLIDVITRVARGEYLINEMVLSRPFVASRVLDQFRELSRLDRTSSGFFSPLTPREIEILDCVARGYSNKEIAQALNISDQTVKNHITSILRKLAVNDRTQAVIYALRHGWIKLEDTKDSLPGPAPSFGRERGRR
jgi:DNA-binding NarL/FixJ family response regulator